MSRAQQVNAVQDAIEHERAEDVRREHTKAADRGARVLRVTDRLLHELIATGMLLDHSRWDDVRVAFFSILASDLYAGAAIDIPPLRGVR